MNEQEERAYYRGCIVAFCGCTCLWIIALALSGVI